MARRRLGPPSFTTDLPNADPSPEALAPSPAAAPAPQMDPAAPMPGASAPSAALTAPLIPADLAALPPRVASRPPIAAIAGQSSAEAALNELAADLRRARDEGRLVQQLPLDVIDETHLVRDRIVLEGEELEALKASLRDRGQQMPIEVVELGQGRFGLISGWRRLTALRQLAADEPQRFGSVLALLRRPAGSAEAYRAMVEENEIRVGLSYYERARITARAVGQGVFPDTFAALAGLFPTASRAKRSKIGSFIRIHDALDDVLRFPAAIPERLGLDLAKALEEPGAAEALRARLHASAPAEVQAELALLAAERPAAVQKQPGTGASVQGAKPASDMAVKPASELASELASAPSTGPVAGLALRLSYRPGKLVLEGEGVDQALAAKLRAWLQLPK